VGYPREDEKKCNRVKKRGVEKTGGHRVKLSQDRSSEKEED